MEKREFQIQIKDLRGFIYYTGVDRFLQMQFIGSVPQEHLVDYIQYISVIQRSLEFN